MRRIGAVSRTHRDVLPPPLGPGSQDTDDLGSQTDRMHRETPRWIRSAAVVVGVVAVLLVGVALALTGVSDPAARSLWGSSSLNNAIIGVSFGLLGPVLAVLRPRNVLGWLLLGLGLANGFGLFCEAYGVHALVQHPGSLPAGLTLAWIGTSIWPLGFGPAFVTLPLLFPSGRLRPGVWRVVLHVGSAASLAMVIGLALSSESLRDDVPGATPPLQSPVGMPLFVVGTLLVVVCVLAVGVRTLVRLHRAQPPVRQQLAWLVLGTLPSFVSLFFAPEAVSAALLSLMPLGLVLGVLRYRLLDISLVLHRTLVYGALTSLVVGVYAGVVAALTALVPHGPFPAVVAAAAVVLLVRPAHALLQRTVTRYVYGDRDDPLRALARLGEQLSGRASGLQRLTDSVCTALRSPVAELWTGSGDALVLAAASPAASRIDGGPDVPRHRVDLAYSGEPVGRLDVGWRTADEPLGDTDLDLLELLAVPIGVAVHADLLTGELRESRTRLQLAADTERDRLRRDLHDGLGPSLSGVVLGLGAARTAASRGQLDLLDDLLARVADEVGSSVAEVRRLVDGLRPSALLAGDLVAAVRAHVDALATGNELRISIVAPETPLALPPTVEEAAYRICLEAVTNVVRHAGARSCEVRIDAGPPLVVTVTDDGTGIPAQRRSGVGLLSMRSRAESVGGCLALSRGGDGGTIVRAEFPLREPVGVADGGAADGGAADGGVADVSAAGGGAASIGAADVGP